MNWSVYNSLTSTSSNSTPTIWGGNHTHNVIGGIPSGTYTVSTTYPPARVIIDIKRCRNCKHAHLAEQSGCVDQEGWNTIFVICSCKEYVPSDNLEYLEYLYKKKINK